VFGASVAIMLGRLRKDVAKGGKKKGRRPEGAGLEV
jgi:hypothetical protein